MEETALARRVVGVRLPGSPPVHMGAERDAIGKPRGAMETVLQDYLHCFEYLLG